MTSAMSPIVAAELSWEIATSQKVPRRTGSWSVASKSMFVPVVQLDLVVERARGCRRYDAALQAEEV